MSANPSDDQWMQYHQHHYQYQNFDESASVPPHHPHGVFFSDSTSVISSSTFTAGGSGNHGTMNNNNNNNNNNNHNSENSENYSCVVTGNDLSPRGSIGKQAVRRRSRASRRTPTTLLNASIKNFRTLVQQYTGCHQNLASSMKTDHQNYKKGGPVNLSFASPSSSSSSRDPINNNDHSDFAAATIKNSLGGKFYSGHDDREYLLQMCQQQRQQQQPPADENSGDFSTFVSTDYNTSGQNTMTVDNYGSWHAVLQ